MPAVAQVPASSWRCATCNTLLGRILPTGEVEVAYKGVAYVIQGKVSTRCRRCEAPCAVSSDK